MENSDIAGRCPGADLDAKRMFSLISLYSNYSNLLLNKEATKSKTLEELNEICRGSDLAILFYAGHGGSSKLKNPAPEEDDGKDEMIFLNDKVLIDDEIWNVISKASGRVFLIFDCCHSETMFRLKTPEKLLASGLRGQKTPLVDMLCWSGCADDKTSQGWINGGFFTNAILKHFHPDKTYDELWSLISSDVNLAKAEIVKRTILRPDSEFIGKAIFH